MTARTRIRKIIKWTALSIAVLLSAALVANKWYRAVCKLPALPICSIGIYRGCLGITYFHQPLGGSVWYELRRNRRADSGPFNWWFDGDVSPTPIPGANSPLWFARIPLWAPILAAGGIGLWTWKLDRTAALRARNNCCKKCGYHRAGLKPDALCPECSTPASSD